MGELTAFTPAVMEAMIKKAQNLTIPDRFIVSARQAEKLVAELGLDRPVTLGEYRGIKIQVDAFMPDNQAILMDGRGQVIKIINLGKEE